MNVKTEFVAVCTVLSVLGLQARNYTWIGGTEGAWGTAANWVADDDPEVHAVPASWQDTATLACADGDITITCSGWLEPNLVFAANVTFLVPEGVSSTVKGSHSGTGNISKAGPGTLTFNGSSSRKGWTYVNEGKVSFSGERVLGESGGCVVGDGEHDAILEINRDVGWPARIFGPGDGAGNLIVKNKGVLAWDSSNTQHTPAAVSNLLIEKGGLVRMGSHSFISPNQVGVYEIVGNMSFLKADTAEGNGELRMGSAELRISGAQEATFVLPVRMTGQYQWNNGSLFAKYNAVGGNGLAVDLHILGGIADAWDARDGLDLIGEGTVKLSGSSTYGGNVSNQGLTNIKRGRLLVDNTEGSGTGYSKVVVAAGATLGGTGTIGGLTTAKVWNRNGDAAITDPCVVVNGAAGNPGVLAPGSYEDTTNARIYGTLTVGSAEAPSSVTMNANTKLAFEAGKGGATGLKVYGPLTLGSNVTLDVNVDKDARTGDYVILSATDGITGSYTLTGNAGAGHLVRTEDEEGRLTALTLRIQKGLVVVVR